MQLDGDEAHGTLVGLEANLVAERASAPQRGFSKRLYDLGDTSSAQRDGRKWALATPREVDGVLNGEVNVSLHAPFVSKRRTTPQSLARRSLSPVAFRAARTTIGGSMTSTNPKTSDTEEQRERTWLVAHDFSSCADAAAELAVDDLIDMKRGGRIVVLHMFTVLAPDAPIEGSALAVGFQHLEASAMVESTRALERVAERLRARARRNGDTAVAIEVKARLGAPAEGALEEADRIGASRIIVGTHGRTGVKHFLLGSVAERIVRRATVPVVVAHAPQSTTATSSRRAEEPRMQP
jgi:nucleotide-binding universal stress UspA family protein